MPEFRCTRNAPYVHKCLGQNDTNSRQGHYVVAKNEEEAIKKMQALFPQDKAGFTVKLWHPLDR